MNWSSYLIQTNLYLLCFYAFYWLILRRETFFGLNRAYLLISALSAALIPLIKVQWLTQLFITKPLQQHFVKASIVIMGGYATPIEESWALGDYLFLLYLCVTVAMVGRLIYKLLKVNSLLKQENQPEAFSFFKKIRVNQTLPQKENIEKHELTHVKQLHSADVLFFELLGIINWFNPIIYLYKKSIRHIHEFIADEAVLKTQTDKKQYALLLLSQRFGANANTLTNNFFNQSLLKRRIEMMNKTKSRKTAVIKYSLSAPLFMLAMALSSAKISESKTIEMISEKVKPNKELGEILGTGAISDLVKSKMEDNNTKVFAESKTDLIKPDSVGKPALAKTAIHEVRVTGYVSNDTANTNPVFTDVEVLPSFPGGLEAFGKFLAQNLRYPDQAKADKIQGRVLCSFIVEKDGSLSNIKVLRGIGSGCDEEAVRVLAISPKWKPGLQNGKIVRVSYTIPVLFQLQDDKKSATPPQPAIDFSSNNRPLIYIDGIECKDQETFKNIKSADIETINVLKDKAATQKYGNKGKDGVIEITTKKK